MLLLLVGWANLRGVREAGRLFAIPLLVVVLARVRRRYRRVFADLALPPLQLIGNCSILWIPAWNRATLDALRYAARVSDRVIWCGSGSAVLLVLLCLLQGLSWETSSPGRW